MPTLSAIIEHRTVTERNSYRYLFTPKHHGGDPNAAQWLPTITLDQEFDVFNTADLHDITDDCGRLYGIMRSGDDLEDLGTLSQQIAEFPFARAGEPWHGYPIWAVSELGPSNRRGQEMRPEKSVFIKMERAGLLTIRERKRLFKGDHV